MTDYQTGEVKEAVVVLEDFTADFNVKVPQAVAEALCAVTGEVKPIGKDGENRFHNYKYATNVDLIQMLRPLMAKHGIIVTQHATGVSRDDGGNMVVKFRYLITHKSGDSWVYPGVWLGVSSDRAKGSILQDKWFSKAATAAEKYFLLKLFKVPAMDDIERLSDGDADADGADKPAAKASTKKADKDTPPEVKEARDLWHTINKELEGVDKEAAQVVWITRASDLVKIKDVNINGYTMLETKFKKIVGEG